MLRRCANLSGHWLRTLSANAASEASVMRSGALVAAYLLLVGCGSTAKLPELEQYPQRSTEQSAAQTPAAGPSAAATASSAEAAAPQPGETSSGAPRESGSKPSRYNRASDKPSEKSGEPPAVDNSAIPPAAQQLFADALAFAAGGDLANAEKVFENLNARYPDFAGPLINLGVLRAKAGNLEAAEQALQAAVERNPDSAPAFNQLGILYRRLGRFKEADSAYLRAVQIDPGYANAYFNLGVLCDLYLQQPQRALEAFERYLELASPPDAKVNGWVSELKARLGNARSARSEQ
jgi:tetratricopeptide (TPR) repeat protein